MARTGTVTGRTVAKNKDGQNQRLMLQVQMSDPDDIQTVEYVPLPGMDSNPINGSKVFILAVGPGYLIALGADDGVDPTSDTGENFQYSVDDSGAVQSVLKLLKSGIIEVNGNADFAVRFDALDTALQSLVTAVNSALAGKLDGGGTPGSLTLDISGAKVDEVKLP